MLFVNLYIIISILVGFRAIKRERRVEAYMSDVPAGDLGLYEPKHVHPAVYVVFPAAYLMLKAWTMFCRTVNALHN